MKIARREKRFILLLAALLTGILLCQVAVFPFLDKRRGLRRGVAAKEAALVELVRLGTQYETRKKGSGDLADILARREADFTLFSFLERAAAKAGIKVHVKSMTPASLPGQGELRIGAVEMKLEDIGLQDLVTYLSRIEQPELAITLGRISMRRNTRDRLDAVVQVLTVE